MDEGPEPIGYARYQGTAPPAVWAGVSRVYVLGFAAPPYEESPAALREVERWGPQMIAAPGGRLTIALRGGRVLGFAVAERLDQDEPWQALLDAAPGWRDAAAGAPPSTVVIVQELAVDPGERGGGIARRLVAELLADRAESHAVLSVYERADSVRGMYGRWGFQEVGTAPAEDGDDTMHLMHHRLPWG